MEALQVRRELTMRLVSRSRGGLKLILRIISPLTLCSRTLLTLRNLTLPLGGNAGLRR